MGGSLRPLPASSPVPLQQPQIVHISDPVVLREICMEIHVSNSIYTWSVQQT